MNERKMAAARLAVLADRLAALLDGIVGADPDDAVGSIKVIYDGDRPSEWLQDAARQAVADYRFLRGQK